MTSTELRNKAEALFERALARVESRDGIPQTLSANDRADAVALAELARTAAHLAESMRRFEQPTA